MDEESDCHPGGDCERSEDHEQSSQLAARLRLRLEERLVFARHSGETFAARGFLFDNRFSQAQEPLHISMMKGEPDAVLILRFGPGPMPGCKKSVNAACANGNSIRVNAW